MNEIYKDMAEKMAIKVRVARIAMKDGAYEKNIRECPFVSELIGMEQALQTMKIAFEYEYDFVSTNDFECITAVTVMGNRVAV